MTKTSSSSSSKRCKETLDLEEYLRDKHYDNLMKANDLINHALKLTDGDYTNLGLCKRTIKEAMEVMEVALKETITIKKALEDE